MINAVSYVAKRRYFLLLEKRIKKPTIQQTMCMKTVIFDGDGKRRDERESCFPNMVKLERARGQVRDDGEK